MKEYNFYGWENANITPVNDDYKFILNPRDLYDKLTRIWCAETCAPRMRHEWSKDNITKGQCSITAFLAQDIFGGKVYGIPLGDGAVHCYNVVGECIFDLTNEQFGHRAKNLKYSDNPEQFRDIHFRKEEKKMRYEYIKAKLKEECLQ